MKKGNRIESYVQSLGAGTTRDPFYEGYFICFNRQCYYEAHDVLEHRWLAEKGPARQFFKGLIQLAGAFVHLQKQFLRPEHPTDRKRLPPAFRLFRLAVNNLEPFSPFYLDLDVRKVLELCSDNMARLKESEFRSNPWNPEEAPRLSLFERPGR